MAETLNTMTGSGNQTATQSPQTAGQSLGGGTASSGVQPGTPADYLRSSNGIPLVNTPVTTVNLNTSGSAGTSTPPPAQHHINPALAGFSIALFVLAIILFWVTARPAKNTT